MDISDFQGIHKYKLILPTVYILSWISMFAGPIYYPVVYEYVNHFCLFYSLIKVVTTLISIVNAIILHQGVLQRVNASPIEVDEEKSFLTPTHQLIYGYVIPNYKEQEEMLAETLSVLASHQRSKQKYCVFLAMEAHEKDSDQKGQRLVEKFKSQFKFINFSMHHIRQYEQKGKASNVSWCVEHLGPILKENNIPEENLFLTIIDADSWVPPIYMDLLEEEIHKNFGDRHINIYEPPQIYTRNNLEVPMFVRIYDIMHGYYHLGNLTSFLDLAAPLSNYTISYQLVKRIGYWDTCPDAIGEDFHTFQKAFWKTNGEVKAKIILAPFNQSNIETGKGYWENIKARFWQGERHSQGCADIAYSMKQLTKNPRMLKGYAMMYFVLQTFVVPAIIPWIFISHLYQTYFLSFFMEIHPPTFTWGIDDFMLLMAILSYISYFLYEYYKRSSNKHIYKQENESILRMMEHVIFNFVNMFMFTIPNFVIATFRVLQKDRVYTVADKKGSVK